jgi:hypothetical protein
MNIILGESQIDDLAARYIVLELDTFKLLPDSDPVTAYGLIEKIPVGEFTQAKNNQELHQNLMKNYKLKNWEFCEHAIDHLSNCWSGDLQTFYHELLNRIENFKIKDPGDDWDGIIVRYS